MDLNLYCDIVKGTDSATVCAYVTSGVTDHGGHIMDPEWIKKALPPWVSKWGNVRSQHRADSAIGTADPASLDMTRGDTPYIELKIVDKAEVDKLNAGVYKGVSLGIMKPVIIADSNAPKGRIVGGEILEISLVDRPANPDAVITLIKAAGPGEWKDMQTGAVLSPEGVASGMAAAELTPASGSPLAERAKLLQLMQTQGETQALAAIVKSANAESNHAMGTKHNVAAPPPGWMPRTHEELQKMEQEAASAPVAVTAAAAVPAVAPIAMEPAPAGSPQAAHLAAVQALEKGDLAAAAVSADRPDSHRSDAHPMSGTHNHSHAHVHPYSSQHVAHQHAHDHQDDDIHGSPHDGRSHGGLADVGMALKAADLGNGGLADKIIAHLVSVPATLTTLKPDVLKAVELAMFDITKAASDFGYTVADASRPPRLEDTTTNGLSVQKDPKPVSAQMEALAGQTDKDRDGDIDGMAAQDKTGSAQKAGADSAPSGESAGSFISPQGLELTFANKEALINSVVKDPGFTAYVASLVKAATLAALTSSEFVTKAAVADQFGSVPQIAKMAGTIASGLQSIAAVTGEIQDGLEGVKAEVAKAAAATDLMKRDLEAVKSVARAEKGVGLGTAALAVTKSFMIDPVTMQAANLPDQAAMLAEAIGDSSVAAKSLLAMSEDERMQLAAKMLKVR